MDTEHIHYFLETVQCGSINKASEKLNLNHQHLGRILTALEREIGAKLLERNRVGVTLTAEGLEVLNMMKDIDILSRQLKYNFKTNPKMKNSGATFEMYSFAMTNFSRFNKFMMDAQKIMPKLTIELHELPNERIMEKMIVSDKASFGTLCSFEDYPSLGLSVENIPTELEVISESSAKLVMLASANNPILNQYESISIESLLGKPLVIYTPYNIEENHFYRIMKQYGYPYIKYKTANLQSFYDIIRNTECVALGGMANNLDALYNPLFRREEQLRMIPIRENIQFKIIRVVNGILRSENRTVLREVVNKHFGY
ncbi:MAG: LysR family transcriptional regulator [Peptococcaceae bacterium]|nr:LysR family transcriptional regulator [Peptococcaceae bacterium]